MLTEYIYRERETETERGARGVKPIVSENGHGDQGSNPGLDYVYFAWGSDPGKVCV